MTDLFSLIKTEKAWKRAVKAGYDHNASGVASLHGCLGELSKIKILARKVSLKSFQL